VSSSWTMSNRWGWTTAKKSAMADDQRKTSFGTLLALTHDGLARCFAAVDTERTRVGVGLVLGLGLAARLTR